MRIDLTRLLLKLMRKPTYPGLIIAFILFFLLNSLTGSSQEVSVQIKNGSLKQFFSLIEKTTPYRFTFLDSDIPNNENITIRVKNRDIEEVLTWILKPRGLQFIREKNSFAIKPTTPHHQIITKGYITDEAAQPIVGANVVSKGTLQGTITDENGYFELASNARTPIMITYIGFLTVELIPTDKTVTIQMQNDLRDIEEIVITALGIRRTEKALSYHIQDVPIKEITTSQDANFVNSLTGKIAGVTINTSSVGIGGATKVIMRGTKSINSNNNALYVIDGVPLVNTNMGTTNGEYSSQPRGEGISDFNPEDIESINILTGPASAALYGSNAANGAIIITTKKGLANKSQINISSYTHFSEPFVMPKFQNRYGNKTGEYASWGRKLDIPSKYHPEDFFRTGYTTQNSVSLSFGSEASQNYLSFGSNNSKGIIPNNTYNRYNFTFKRSSKLLTDRLLLDIGVGYILQDDNNMMAQGKYFNPLTSAYTFPRGENPSEIKDYERFNETRQIKTQHWPWGDQGLNMQNPYWIANRNLHHSKKDRHMINFNLKYDFNSWLNISGRARLDYSNTDLTKKYYASTLSLFAGPKGFYSAQKENEKQLYADLIANINKKYGDITMMANLGTSLSDSRSDAGGYQGPLKDIPNFFAFDNIDKNGRDATPLQDGWREQVQSVFANLEAGWRNTLFLTVTGRQDWSSALANMPQTSFFYPSVGVSMVVSELCHLPSTINFLKIRGAYSSVGSSIPRFLSIPTYAKNDATGSWETNSYMPVGELYPERTESFETGINIKTWHGRLNLDATYYLSNTYNQTFQPSISASSGWSSMYVQSGNVRNTGLELIATSNNKWYQFSWNANFVLSYNKNKIIELVDRFTDPTGKIGSINRISQGGIGSSEIILTKGGTIGDLWTKTEVKKDADGQIWINPQTGKLAIEENVLKKAGSVLPKYNLSLRNEWSYKNVSLGLMFYARLGGVTVSQTQAILDGLGVSEASAQARDNGGVMVGDQTIDAQTWYETVGAAGVYSHYIYSASNVRLQEATLTYTHSLNLWDRKTIVTVSVLGKNLWMIYNKSPFDPEVTPSTGTYFQGFDYFMQPGLRNYGFSIRLQL